MNRLLIALAPFLVTSLILGACRDADAPVACAGEDRVPLDCDAEISYDGVKAKGGTDLFNVVSIEGEVEQRAIREVSEAMKQYVAMHGRACRDYNACILDKDSYLAQSEEIRQRMAVVPAVMNALSAAKSPKERLALIDRLYRGVVPADARDREVTFDLGVHATLPESLGGRSLIVEQGTRVPTDTSMHFTVEVDRTAYLYLFQADPTGAVTVLFPNPKISAGNPLPAGQEQRIPQSGKRFRVNEDNLGTERVYVVVSRKPVAQLEAAIEKALAGSVTKVGDDPWLASVASVRPAAASADCDQRALELTDDEGCSDERALELTDDEGAAPTSVRVRPHPGDDVIVTVLEFEHVDAADYRP